MNPSPSPPIIFIGGSGRSGTNITKELLGRHPQVATLPFEYRFIIDPDGLVDFYRSYPAAWTPYLADRRLKRLERLLRDLSGEPTCHRQAGRLLRRFNHDGKIISPRRYHGWQLDKHLPGFSQQSAELIAQLRAFSFPACWVGTESYQFRPQLYHAGPLSQPELARLLGGFIGRVIQSYLDRNGKQFFVEDNTWNILVAQELLELAPQAKILHVYRDPRDVVASLVRQRWSPPNVQQAAIWYRDMMAHWFRVRANLPPGSFLEFSLESLVNDTETTVRQICHFSSLPFDPVLLQTDLSRSRSGRWQSDLSPAGQRTVQSIIGDFIEQLGYA